MGAFLIRCVDGDWFDLSLPDYPEVFHPTSFESVRIEGFGEYRIKVQEVEIWFSYEDPGIQIVFESEGLSEGEMKQVVREIRDRISLKTGQRGRVVSL